MQKDMQGATMSRFVAHLAHGSIKLPVLIHGYFGVGQHRDSTNVVWPDPVKVARAAALFAQALNEDSNLELDWLWYATQMTSNAQRQVCYERALQINPNSGSAQRALATLAREATA